jgi:hypothetical protein
MTNIESRAGSSVMELGEVDEDTRSRKRSATMRGMQIRMEVSSQPSILLVSSSSQLSMFRRKRTLEFFPRVSIWRTRHGKNVTRDPCRRKKGLRLEILSVLFRTTLT